MLMRDRLLARMADFCGPPDYQALVRDVLGVKNAPPELARRLVAQALVVEDRREAWETAGERIVSSAPCRPGVYVLRDERGTALYVGKAISLRRRLRTHFAPRRWRSVKPELARAVGAEWQEVGSELEAIVREAALIDELHPVVNVQTAPPRLETRALPTALVRDVVVVAPSVDADSVELVAARADGGCLLERTGRGAVDVIRHAKVLNRFFQTSARTPPRPLGPFAPLVFSWLAGRGQKATRLDPHEAPSARVLASALGAIIADEDLFRDRIVVVHSRFRPTPKRP
jgi:predicted GIY-YIG superfamily endonuclease